jgi:tetratricopeptide (TPR) repeat protein
MASDQPRCGVVYRAQPDGYQRGVYEHMPSETKAIRSRVLELARKDERKGDWKSALRRYRRLTGLEPNEPTLQMKLGDVCLRLGQKSEAADAFFQAGLLFAKAAFDEKAAALCKRALDLEPGRVDVRDALVDAYRRLDRVPEAIVTLVQASELADEQGDAQEALRLRRRIAELDPLAVDTRLRLGEDLERIENRGEALHEYAESMLELLRQRNFERALGVFASIGALRPQLGPDVEDGEPTADSVDRLVAHAEESQAYFDGVRNLYQRVALLYHRERGLP